MLPPLQFRLAQTDVRGRNWSCDAIVKADWGERELNFAATVKRYSSDRNMAEAMRESRFVANKLLAYPLVIAPWLSEEQLEMLESEGVSGIDLCGNVCATSAVLS